MCKHLVHPVGKWLVVKYAVFRVLKKESLLFQPKGTWGAYDDADMYVPAFSLCGFLQDFVSCMQ